MINSDILDSIDESVLCWLATVSMDGVPNVSPKEIFCWFHDHFLIANIASPGSVKNIEQNKNVSVSFIDILIQKGFQLKGTAEIIKDTDITFDEFSKPLIHLAGDLYPFKSLIKIKINKTKTIVAPSYTFYPDIPTEQKIRDAKKQYGLIPT